MSWIQNLFEKFKKEEDEFDEEYQLKKENISVPAMKNSSEHSKDLDARISYQYPKGHFRFPVIPDEHKKKMEHLRHSHREKQREERKHTRTETEVNKETVQISREMRTTRYSGRPFRPTEIPSPIFGFSRPRQPIIEHELTHFSPSLTQESPMEEMTDKITSQILRPIELQTEYVQFQEKAEMKNEFIPETLMIKHNEIIQSEEKDEKIDQPIPETLIEQSEVIQSEEKDEKIDQPILEPLIEQSEVILSEEKDEKIDQLISETFIEQSGTIQIQAEDRKTDESIPETLVTKQAEIMEIDEKEERNEPPLTQTIVSEQPEMVKDEKKAGNEEPKRSHLPFNVLMLKQDKQKWDGRKIEAAAKPENNIKQLQSEAAERIKQPVEQQSVPVKDQIQEDIRIDSGGFEFPSYQLLNPPVAEVMNREWILEQEQILNQTLENFNVGAKVVNVTQGPSVTRFEVQPEPGVKVNKVTNLADDIKLSLAARDIRIEAPIPGKHTIGIEVPNQKSRPVLISEIIQSRIFAESKSPLTAVLGLDISGKPIVTDLKKMPHGLIAGATGSGKSVCINSILVSLLYKASPEDLKLLLIDPKMVELAPYNKIPHLVSPVITDVKAATAALKWAVEEMERRYELFAHTGVRDINRFNELAIQHKQYSDKLPFIVIVIDELADLMMMSPADVEEAICRIAQKARACGIHLIIATQRPSVDVITGLIKANVPTRIAFSVSSQIDSRTIIDISGAEKLLGRGDMLFLENGSSKPVRLQGTFVSDEEIDFVVGFVREQREPDYLFEQEELLKKAQVSEEEDELFYEACEFVVDQACASTSSLQRRFKIGYNRAARLMDLMEQQGYISGARGSKPREVYISAADLEAIQEASI